MAIKNNIDQLDNNDLIKYLNTNKINPNTFISNGTYTIPLFVLFNENWTTGFGY